MPVGRGEELQARDELTRDPEALTGLLPGSWRAVAASRLSKPFPRSVISQTKRPSARPTRSDRSGRTATLTTAGAAALEHARAVLASANAVRQAVDDVSGLLRGQVVVGMVTACTVSPLFDALAAFALAHSRVELSLIEDTSDRLVERVRNGEMDLALVGAPARRRRGWTRC